MSSRTRPGTITINPRIDPLTPGDTDRIDLREVSAGPNNKPRYLRKFVPFQAVVVDSYSDTVRLQASVDGSNFHPVPEDTARTFDSTAIEQVHVRNPSGSGNNVDAADVEIILFTPDRAEPEPQFSLFNLIPGFSLEGGGQ